MEAQYGRRRTHWIYAHHTLCNNAVPSPLFVYGCAGGVGWFCGSAAAVLGGSESAGI